MGLGKTYSTSYLADSNNNTGEDGQVLISTATGINWVDGSGVTGGPFLPLSAGAGFPLTGTLSAGDIEIKSGSKLFLNNPVNTASGSIVCPGGGSLALQSYGNNMIYLNENAEIRFSTSSSQQMVINASGNVGIGTTSPISELHVVGSARVVTNDSAGGDTLIGAISGVSNGYRILTNTSNEITYSWNTGDNVQAVTINNSGNVGIGLANPSQKLSVLGNIYQRTGDFITWNNGDAQIGAVSGYNLAFSTYDGSSTMVERMRITSAGNVGIGTTAPAKKLHVKESTTATYAAYIENSVAGGDYLAMIGDAGDNVFEFDSGGTGGEAQMKMYSDGVLKNVLDAEGSSYFNGGNVGIGTTSPSNKLHVNIPGNDVAFRVSRNNGTDGDLEISFSNAITAYNSKVNGHRWLENGSEKMRLNAGNLGIGTTSPLSTLHVNKENASSVLTISRGGTDLPVSTDIGDIDFKADYSGSPISYGGIKMSSNSISGVRSSLRFNVKSTSGSIQTGLTVQGNAGTPNVGIGTSSPTPKLHLVYTGGTYSADATSGFINQADTGRATMRLRSIQDQASELFFDVDGGARWDVSARPSSQGHSLNFYPQAGTPQYGLVSAHTFQLSQNGDVIVTGAGTSGKMGIGTTSPTQKLDVNGDIALKGTSVFNLNSAALTIGDTAGTDSVTTLKLTTAGDSTTVYLDDDGNVGIGTTDPKAALDVKGRFLVDSKTMTITNSFNDALTVVMSNHTGCYVKITAFGNWNNHSSISYLGEFFLNNGAGGYNEPGLIIRQIDGTASDAIEAQIVDPGGTTGDREFIIQLRATATASFTAYLTYNIQGMFVSAS
jgi:hypothetical protein